MEPQVGQGGASLSRLYVARTPLDPFAFPFACAGAGRVFASTICCAARADGAAGAAPGVSALLAESEPVSSLGRNLSASQRKM